MICSVKQTMICKLYMYMTEWACKSVWKDSNQILTLVVGILGKD